MLAFIIALLIVVIIGSIVYGIYKIIAGISKFGFVQSMQKSKGKRCRKSSTDQPKRTYNKQSTTENRNKKYYRRQENKNPLDEDYWNRQWNEDDEDVFDDGPDTDTDGTDSDVTKTGELELEQAFVNYHTEKFGLQAGVILPSVGLINEYHEPPLFVSVERPEYNKYVIPTTWFGNGFAVYGSMSGLNWRVALMEDMEGEGIGAGIRSGRGKGYKTTAYDWVKNISLNYTGIAGLRIGGSYTMNNAPIDNNPDSTVSFGLAEANLRYDANNIYAVLEYGDISYKNNPNDYTSSGGYYLDLGYNVAGLVGLEGKLMPWLRVSDYNRGTTDGTVNPDKHYSIQRFGLTYWPISNIAFKFDYGTHKNKYLELIPQSLH